MRKRIRLHQVRIGMFVEDLECTPGVTDPPFSPFLIKAQSDVARIMKSSAMSVVIDTRRGIDTGEAGPLVTVLDPERFEKSLRGRFSPDEIREARQSVEKTVPYIRNLFGEARMNGVFAVDSAHAAVEQVMASAVSNTGALVGILRLKNADEASFLHSLAVSALMIGFGRRLELNDADIQLLAFGGLVHDLGKMLMPKGILLKEGELSIREMAVIRRHPELGYEMLKGIEGISQTVLDICLHHHERWNGTGYPSGLAGKTIPHAARVAAICDVYEAMTTIRPYKRAWSPQDTIDMMRRSEGHFDPVLLRMFVSNMINAGVLR
ncbi:HD-GYP domain-containing protein [Rhizobiaceae bacterium BDR2-2]|uniref:HD-GYP domain-containing protein n=1 Tax=Ectorhizobium quercum TaxID=2965071 RepID=A0AAE3STW4_9HYPH|nr:HD-GYP domain-containing protein [Ectorhizobium quercum]MCX8996605.1 HD-GYP domain-containing protein [Ectorhizobium quercum]